MAYDLQEQEQFEAIKAWWTDYGKLVMLAVIACLVTIAAFQGWGYYQARQAGGAATLFSQLDEADRAKNPKKVRDIAAQVVERYGSAGKALRQVLDCDRRHGGRVRRDERRTSLEIRRPGWRLPRPAGWARPPWPRQRSRRPEWPGEPLW